MEKRLIINLIGVISLVFSAFSMAEDAESTGGEAVAVNPELEQNISYFFGYALGNNLLQGGVKGIIFPQMQMGMEDAMSGKQANLSQEQQAAVIAEIQSRQKTAQEAALSAGLEAAQQFLAENAKRDGVKVTESGLQYEVLSEGTGKSPVATDTVKVHYVGTLIDGNEFDSSIRRGEPAEFVLNQVIPGWTEGLQLMKEGAKYRFTLAPELAYGPGGTRGIPPNSVLIFEVELLEVKSGS